MWLKQTKTDGIVFRIRFPGEYLQLEYKINSAAAVGSR